MFLDEILFIPDPTATYDLQSTDLIDNRRVPLLPDPRIQRALDYLSQVTSLINSVQGVNVLVPQPMARKIQVCQNEASRLLSQVE